MFKKNLLVLLAVALLSTAALATTVTYSTTGAFTSSGTNSISAGGMTISFAGVNSSSVNAPTNIGFGDFTVTGSGSNTFSDTFTLTIHQTVPSAGSASSSTTVSGSINGTSSGISLQFFPASVSIGTNPQVIYSFFPLGSNQGSTVYGLNPPSVNNGDTSIQGSVTVVPEPSSMLLLGTGLSGLAGFIRRRRK